MILYSVVDLDTEVPEDLGRQSGKQYCQQSIMKAIYDSHAVILFFVLSSLDPASGPMTCVIGAQRYASNAHKG